MREKKKRHGIFEYIKRRDSDQLFSWDLSFSLEMIGNSELMLYGCREIKKYSCEEMIFEAKNFDVSVSGECLNCAVYHVQGVEISGDIRSIKFIVRGELNESNIQPFGVCKN